MSSFKGSGGTTLTAQLRAVSGIVNSETLTGTKTLDGTSANIQILDPGGASRTVTLPRVGYGTLILVLFNSANVAGELLNVTDSAAVAVTSLDAGEACLLAYDGTAWRTGPLNVTDAGDGTIQADVIQESTAGAGVTVDGVLLKDGKVDLNGVAGALILDADADTHIGASTGNQIDVTIGGAIDFVMTANTLTAVSGSAIATNTIAETTAANGVSIDGLRLKDAAVAPIAGGSAFIDLTACATGEADVVLADNLADAFSVREAANSYLRITTTNDAERITVQKVQALTVTTIDMADAAHALVYGTAGAGQTKLLGNLVVCDPNSGGASEDLTLPPEATSVGVQLTIVNSGGEGIVVKDDGGGTVITLDTAQHGLVFCDGTTWRGFMGAVT